MNYKKLFFETLVFSIIIQILTGILEVGSLFVKVPSSGNLIRQLLILEILVQVIEGAFYVWLGLNFNKVANITPKRYIDWAITTPTMLITLVFYLIYQQYRDKGENTDKLDFFSLFSQHSSSLTHILGLNWMMLLFGYLGEAKVIDTLTGVVLGFIPFIIYYAIIYFKYVQHSNNGWKLFTYFFVFWSIYGFAAVLPYYQKNSVYNILDLFAKNFFGVFLSYIILSGRY
jgi:bacteriorhodopsin